MNKQLCIYEEPLKAHGIKYLDNVIRNCEDLEQEMPEVYQNAYEFAHSRAEVMDETMQSTYKDHHFDFNKSRAYLRKKEKLLEMKRQSNLTDTGALDVVYRNVMQYNAKRKVRYLHVADFNQPKIRRALAVHKRDFGSRSCDIYPKSVGQKIHFKTDQQLRKQLRRDRQAVGPQKIRRLDNAQRLEVSDVVSSELKKVFADQVDRSKSNAAAPHLLDAKEQINKRHQRNFSVPDQMQALVLLQENRSAAHLGNTFSVQTTSKISKEPTLDFEEEIRSEMAKRYETIKKIEQLKKLRKPYAVQQANQPVRLPRI